MNIKQHIQDTIDQLKAARDEYIAEFDRHPFVIETNRQLAMQNGAIQALEQLLEETEQVQPTNGRVEHEMAKVLHE